MQLRSPKQDITHTEEQAPQGSQGRFSGWVAARREWDARYGDFIKRAQNWRLIALVLAVANLFLIAGMISVASRSHVVPYIVAVDSIGKAEAVGPADMASIPDERVKRAILLQWIEDVRSISSDPQAEYRTVTQRVYTHLAAGSPAQLYVGDFYRSDSPFDRGQDGTVQVDIQSIVQDSPRTYRVNWTETSRDKTGAVTGKQVWQGAFTLAVNPPRDEKLIRVNPLGIYVTEASWSKVYGGNNQ
jgi:type IV secretion system protein TrbF